MVMPGGAWQTEGDRLHISGTLYKPNAAQWIGVPYDATRLLTTIVGSLRLDVGASTLVNQIEMLSVFTAGEFAGTNQVKKLCANCVDC
ncbi:MAG: hypothetical protein HC782_04355 [Gammaproteobacteria bacterium]|nr:hypothetical protein [Gammaproteobacteria bacterium]